ncbi:MAG: bifunctional diaminohydroxyphosphoribosylaminopyrimidine deaminase/5-amino-6-(5-phosphoribosylamino)uracil reductase RibD [Rhodospirillales bacterium]
MTSTSSTTDSADARWMAAAQRLALRGLGRVWPNPAVGCVIAGPGGFALGRGWTQPGGRPHAETQALKQAGPAAAGGTAYITLEPCAHHGETPPCAEALINAGVRRAVIACLDPDPRVNGRGVEMLAAAGVTVSVGVGREDAVRANAGFFLRVRQNRPLVALKTAMTLDGRIAARGGKSRWITGPAARARGHYLRATHDAVLIGAGTALADNPSLTCRLPGMAARSPVRVVLDSRGRTPKGAPNLFGAEGPATWLFTAEGAALESSLGLSPPHKVFTVPAAEGEGGGLDVRAVLARLAEEGVTRVLIEGGGGIAGSFMAAGLIDVIHVFRAPSVVGAEGVPAVSGLSAENPSEAPRFERTHLEPLAGDDIYEVLERGGLAAALLADGAPGA